MSQQLTTTTTSSETSSTSATTSSSPSASSTSDITSGTIAPVASPSANTTGALNTGCIDEPGTKTGSPGDWYRDDAIGVVTLDIGELSDNPPSAAPLADILTSLSADTGQINTWEFASADEPSCIIGRGAALIRPDGSQIRLSVWRLVDAVSLASVPQHAPFVPKQPDLFVSDGSTAGDVTALKVREDGTTIKVVALGVDAFGFGGWPTTTAPRPDQVPRAPRQTIDDVAAIAERVAETLTR